ncbi:MAG: helix-turn-helix domain-containing protein [Oscillospiraceae bacterium]|jgi:transcriptional regulator with XRE-family HTH domain|nr:helix-turn-helix domain-containing protein [Oscillospiraceae bacterium]
MNSIKAMRLRANLQQNELAAKLGVDQSSVSYWETGKTMPRSDSLRKIADVLNCTIDELLSPSDPDEETTDEHEAD